MRMQREAVRNAAGNYFPDLDANDTYGEKYDKYWELEKGYLDYIDYISLRKANAAGYLVSEEKLEEFRSRIIQNANNCRNQENQVILQSYAAKVD